MSCRQSVDRGRRSLIDFCAAGLEFRISSPFVMMVDGKLTDLSRVWATRNMTASFMNMRIFMSMCLLEKYLFLTASTNDPGYWHDPKNWRQQAPPFLVGGVARLYPVRRQR